MHRPNTARFGTEVKGDEANNMRQIVIGELGTKSIPNLRGRKTPTVGTEVEGDEWKNMRYKNTNYDQVVDSYTK